MNKYFLNPEVYAAKDESGEFRYNNLSLTPVLTTQLKSIYPRKSEEDINQIARRISEEFETTTPSIATWQDFYWPVENGDYCQLIMLAGKADLNKLAVDGDGEKLFVQSLVDKASDENAKMLWKSLKDDSLVEGGRVDFNWPVIALVFKDLSNGNIYILVDQS